MLITRDFVFIHMPKTGGTFIKKFFEPVYEGDDHATAAEIPAEYSHLPVFSVVRNPWDWYVSWFHFQSSLSDQHDMWSVFSDDGRLGFSETVRRACGEIESDNPMVGTMHNQGLDYLTLLFLATVGRYDEELGRFKLGGVEVGHFERLLQDFAAFLERHEIAVPEGLFETPPINTSARGDYRQYYDPALAQLVAEKTSPLTSAYGYSF